MLLHSGWEHLIWPFTAMIRPNNLRRACYDGAGKTALMLKRRSIIAVLFTATIIFAPLVSAAGGGQNHGLDPMVLVGVAVILICAKLGGELFERMGQPAVLGELVAGILVGNLTLVHFYAFESIKNNEVITAIAELGVIILLFEVGLESNQKEMRAVGLSALLAATAGVITPFFLGWIVAAYFLPDAGRWTHIFVGATLCATSIGITARVLRDLGKLNTREARIILGAAVLDDVMALIILAVVSGVIRAVSAGGAWSLTAVAIAAAKAIGFLAGSVLIGQLVMPLIFRGAARFANRGLMLSFAIAFCFLMSWAATRVGLAAIIGAFATGLILEEVHFEHLPDQSKHDLLELVAPVGAVLTPVFFVLIGTKVDLRLFASPGVVAFAAAIIAVAIVGKQAASLVVLERGVNRFAVGVGMIPRGEVELIFAGVGASLLLPNALGQLTPVVGPSTFTAIVLMVIVTTLVTPPLLKRLFASPRVRS
jgi:Kef-type K+ transport system membrane component KefB